MASHSPDVKILVHVAAPSRVADDAVYRQLAREYLAFQPTTTFDLPPAASTESPNDAADENHGKKREGHQQVQVQVSAESSSQDYVTPATAHAFGPESQDLSFQSAIDNRASPRLRTLRQRKASQHHIAASPSSSFDKAPIDTAAQASWHAPASQISDSYPLPDAGILNATPTRILQRYLGQPPSPTPSTSSSPSKSRRRQSQQPASSAHGREEVIDVPSSVPIPDSDEHYDSLQHKNLRGKVIPVTPVVPPGTSRKRKAPPPEEDEADQAVFDVTHVSNSFVSVPSGSSPPRAESEPPRPLKKTKQHQTSITEEPEPESTNLARSSSDTGPIIRSSDPSAIEIIGTTLEIRPPSPPVGVLDLDPPYLVSDKLAKLARDLSSRYKPTLHRQFEPEPFERGYWLVDCTSWTPETRLDTWVFLANYLRSGLAGWGVWCRRDKLHDSIRLYCWGHVAKHIYLLLYLASGRQIKMTGAKWFDADGEVVLEVPRSK